MKSVILGCRRLVIVKSVSGQGSRYNPCALPSLGSAHKNREVFCQCLIRTFRPYNFCVLAREAEKNHAEYTWSIINGKSYSLGLRFHTATCGRGPKFQSEMLHIQGHQSLPGTGSNLKQMPYTHCPESARCWSKLSTSALYAYRPNFSKYCP